jgi:hypothetical protein
VRSHAFVALVILSLILTVIPPAGARSGAVEPSPGSSHQPATAVTRVFLPFVSGSNLAQIPDTTKVLSPATLRYLVAVDGADYVFSQVTPELAALQAGDIIVGEATSAVPNGFLREVKGVWQRNGQVVVETGGANITDAVDSGSVQVSHRLTPAGVRSTSARAGVQYSPARRGPEADRFVYRLEDVVLLDQDGDPATTGDQIVVNGTITLEPSFTYEMVLEEGRLEWLDFQMAQHEIADLVVEARAGVWFGAEVPIVEQVFAPVTVWIGPVPVVIVPVLTVTVGVDGRVRAGVTAGVRQEATVAVGVLYDGDGWSTRGEFDNQFAFAPPVITADRARVKGYTTATLALLLYGVLGPDAQVKPYLELDADRSATPWWQLYGGLTVKAGVRLVIFGIPLPVRFTIIDERWLLVWAEG